MSKKILSNNVIVVSTYPYDKTLGYLEYRIEIIRKHLATGISSMKWDSIIGTIANKYYKEDNII